MKARCEAPSLLEQLYPNKDHASIGYSPVDQSLKTFLTSTPAAAALFRILYGFSRTHTKAQCRDIIENYVETGLGDGITEKTMRAACGLPQQGMGRSACALSRSLLPHGHLLGEAFNTASSKFGARGSGRAVTRVIALSSQVLQHLARKTQSSPWLNEAFQIVWYPSKAVTWTHQTRTVVHEAGTGRCFRIFARSGCEGCIPLKHSTSAQCTRGGLDSMRVVESVVKAE